MRNFNYIAVFAITLLGDTHSQRKPLPFQITFLNKIARDE